MDLHESGCELILANTYHLYLRPGHQLVAEMGGLHHFMGWHGPILTDSGGFQVFSLAHQRQLDDDGVTFRSHIDGSRHRFTPELVMEIEQTLGPDIAMVLDECAEPLDYAYNKLALARTHRWAERCKIAHNRPDQALFGIVQGGIFPELRIEECSILNRIRFHRLCDWWIGRGRNEGTDVHHAGHHMPAYSHSEATLSDGCGRAGRYCRGGLSRH